MNIKGITKRRLFSLCLMLTITLVSCGQYTKFETKDNYLKLQYPKEMKYEEAEINNNQTHSFYYDDQNFIILAKETLTPEKSAEMSTDILRANVINYSKPFTEQGFIVDYEDIIKINETNVYKFVITNGTFNVTYLQWYDIGKEQSYLYKVMYVYDKDHQEPIENAIYSIEIAKKNK